jgi:hypothetical protein
MGWTPETPLRDRRRRKTVEETRAEAIAIIRRASTMPRCQFVSLDRKTVSRDRLIYLDTVRGLLSLVETSVADRRKQGDLAGTWDDLMVLFRMARQLSGPVPLEQTRAALDAEERALALAIDWSSDSHQTPEQLLAALDAYRSLPAMPPPGEGVRAETVIVDNTLNLPADELALLLRRHQTVGVNEFENTATALYLAAMTSPWEIARTRRAFWLYVRDTSDTLVWDYKVLNESQHRQDSRRSRIMNLLNIRTTTPLLNELVPNAFGLFEENTRNEVSRRALLLILGLRHWQVTHEGRLPKELSQLVSAGTLRAVPNDPYDESRPFGYLRSTNRGPRSPRGSIMMYYMIYSVGPDHRDDRAWSGVNDRTGQGDIFFSLPSEPPLSQ